MTAPLALALVEHAPDHRTAEIAARDAIRAGATADQLRLAWRHWQIRHRADLLRGESE